MSNHSYKKMIEAERKAKKYFRFGEVDKIVKLYFEIAGNMGTYQGMKEEIWKKIFKVGALYEQKKEISKELIQKLFQELSTEIQKEKSPQGAESQKKRGGQVGNQNARKGGLYATLQEDRETDLYKHCLQNLKQDYQHLMRFVDISNMEDMALLKVEQEKVKLHKAHYLRKYQNEQFCNPKIVLLATNGKAPELNGNCSQILTHYKNISIQEREAELHILENKIRMLEEKRREAEDLVADLYAEGAYRKKTPQELKEFNIRQKNALGLLGMVQADQERCESRYYAIQYVEEVWEYIHNIPDAETKYWGSLLTREIRVQRAIDAKVRLLATAEQQMQALLKALYSFSETMDSKEGNAFGDAQKQTIIEAVSGFSGAALSGYRKKTA